VIDRIVNKVFCGDALRLLQSVPDICIPAFIADPMYGTSKRCRYDWGFDPAGGDPIRHWRYHRPIYEEVRRVLRPGGVLAWAVGAPFCEHFSDWFGGHRLWSLIRFNRQRKDVSHHCWVVQTREQQPIECPAKDPLIIYDDARHLKKLHPCTKPPEELAFLIEALTRPGELVLDPFCGLGPTLVAAERLGRRWIGCDRSRRYCQIALRRLLLLGHRGGGHGRIGASRNGATPSEHSRCSRQPSHEGPS
jgi:site-specific DNA-methyltransferase (adenine-specific)